MPANKRYSAEEISYITSQHGKSGVSLMDIVKGCKAKFGTVRSENTVDYIGKNAHEDPRYKQAIEGPAKAIAAIVDQTPLKTAKLSDSVLEDFIPKEMEDGYLERAEVLNQVEAILRMPAEERKPIFLIGDTATGKTSTGRYLAFKHKLPILIVQVDASLNFNDLLYKVDFVNATAKYEPGLFVRFLQQPCIIMLDELPSATPEIFFKLHELLQERQMFVKELGRVVKQHDDCYIFATGNFKNSLYIGNNKMNEALLSRFMIKMMEDFTDQEIEQIIEMDNKQLKKQLIQFYREVQQVIKKQNKKYLITLRNLQTIARLHNKKLPMKEALEWGFLDGITVNNNLEERKAIWNLAITCGLMNEPKQQVAKSEDDEEVL